MFRSRTISEGVKEGLRIAFQPEGGPLQDILIKEAARLTGSSAASAINTTLFQAAELAEQTPLAFLPFPKVRLPQPISASLLSLSLFSLRLNESG